MTTRTLLAVLAHPDDESFGMGGTLALYASRGADVYLVCATRGEVGTVDPEYMQGFSSIAELRESELRCAAEHLGLKGVYFLDYRDSGMPGSPDNQHPDAQVAHSVDEVAGRVVKYIREIKPDVVLTFDPIGGYRHPDHIHIHNATVLAFEKAADASFHPEAGSPFQPRALYFHTIPRGLFKFGVRLLKLFGRDPRKWGRNHDIDLVSLAEVDFPVHARIDYRSVSEQKEQAGSCHASQGGGQMRRGFVGLFFSMFDGVETFMRAYPPINGSARATKDLFEGI
ncbi:MAG TPA: PIG-L family deacetylase [Anaerolineales bacterium]|nr:PIG-L family deacetylase [Anaerolineales bacterium]